MVNPVPIARFSVGEPDVAEVTIVSPTEVIINGKGLGTTTLFVWDNQGQVRVYSVEVTADAPGLERFLRALMPDEEIQVTASRNAVTLSGNVKDPTRWQRRADGPDDRRHGDRQPGGAAGGSGAAQGAVRRDQPDRAEGLVRPATRAQPS